MTSDAVLCSRLCSIGQMANMIDRTLPSGRVECGLLGTLPRSRMHAHAVAGVTQCPFWREERRTRSLLPTQVVFFCSFTWCSVKGHSPYPAAAGATRLPPAPSHCGGANLTSKPPCMLGARATVIPANSMPGQVAHFPPTNHNPLP